MEGFGLSTPVLLGITLILSYLIGSVPLTWLLVKVIKGKDLHEYGSGNAGASNAFTTTHSIPITVIGGFFDLIKGYLCMFLAAKLGLPLYFQLLAGLGAILGHNYSLFLKGSGGRGVLTTVGVLFYMSPWLAVIALVIALSFVPFHQLALGTVLAASATAVLVSAVPQLFGFTEKGTANYMAVTAFLILALLIVRRLMAKRTALSANEPLWRVLLCRALFDRDIPNREAWINQDRTLPIAD